MQTLEEDDHDQSLKDFLHELKSTLTDIQRYGFEFPSGQFTNDIMRLLQIMQSPLDSFHCFVEAYYRTLTDRSQTSKSEGGPESKKLSELSGKTTELKDGICHHITLVRTLLLLHSL